jgi:hypothetical protein
MLSNLNVALDHEIVSLGAGTLHFRKTIFSAVYVDVIIRTSFKPAGLEASITSAAEMLWSGRLWKYKFAVTGRLVASAMARKMFLA